MAETRRRRRRNSTNSGSEFSGEEDLKESGKYARNRTQGCAIVKMFLNGSCNRFLRLND